MAEKSSSSPSNPKQDSFVFLFLLMGLFVLWFITGGPGRLPESDFSQNQSTETRNELRSINDIELSSAKTRAGVEENIAITTEELQRIQRELVQIRTKGVSSPYTDMVHLRKGRAREKFAHTEYVELTADRNNTTDISITGWTLESLVTGQRATIGGATHLPFLGVVNTHSTLFLSPGEEVTVATGRSPIGINFRVNQCTGYFEQFQDFSPRLKKECPDPEDEFKQFSTIPITNVRLEDDERYICQEFIDDNINRCEINRVNFNDLTPKIESSCRAFIEETYTYNGCVENHRSDSGFFKSTWRVFLGSHAELWREKGEVIKLLDQEGRVVDIIDY